MRTILASMLLLGLLLAESLSAGGLVQARLETRYGIQEGDTAEVALEIFSSVAIGGIDFTVHYDSSKLSFVDVTQDVGLNNWELFTPSEVDSFSAVQVISIADTQNGPVHPDPHDFYPSGVAARYRFVVEEPITETPLEFFWLRCGDNACSNTEGDSLFVISRLSDSDGNVIWDETDDVNYPDAGRPPHIGLPDTCIQRATTVYYVVEMTNGLLSSEYNCGDASGDGLINITDAVFIIQFIFNGGPPPQPTPAGDLNCDSITNITDVVYIIQYIFAGGPEPCADCP